VLADELKSAADRGRPDDGSAYYEHWLAALEHLVTAKGLSNPNEMLARKEAWADAYRHTPHGKPVDLAKESSYCRFEPPRFFEAAAWFSRARWGSVCSGYSFAT
jgi:hypothetical protein